jgi:hypothetical protein
MFSFIVFISEAGMETGNCKTLLKLQHPLSDYLRVAVIAIIVLIALFIVKKLGSGHKMVINGSVGGT